MHYNPAEQIDADQWLSIDEDERLYAIQCWLSELTGSDIDDCLLEAVPILAVENQVAMNSPPVTQATLERLLYGGIDRMTAIQVMSEVMAESLSAVVSEQQDYDSDAFARALEQIDPAEIALDDPNDEAARKGAIGLEYRQMPSAPPPRQPVRSEKIGRNQPCPCGSGKKYKKCCGRPGAGRLH